MTAGAKKHPDTLRAMELYRKGCSIAKAADRAGINPSTLYRALFRNGKNGSKKRRALRK
jgi:lambda repressor-like predicted transcriptional regulator